MQHITRLEKRLGVDLRGGGDLHPSDGEGRVGKSGLDKNLTLQEIFEIVYRMEVRPNIIIKAGVNAKWYIKRCAKELIDEGIAKWHWRDTSRGTMWIVEWDA